MASRPQVPTLPQLKRRRGPKIQRASLRQKGELPIAEIGEITFDEEAELSTAENGGTTPEELDFNDRFPEEILENIFKYVWRPVHCWEAAKVCKRWCTLLASNLLLKRSNHGCTGPEKGDGSKRRICSSGPRGRLKLKKAESEWRLAMDLLNACKQHTLSLEIKDLTHLSFRGYQLIAAFASSNLKTIRLESCNSMDEATLGSIITTCPSLRSIHLPVVPKLTLKTIEKARKLQELHVYGCASVTSSTVLSVLNSCPELHSLCLSAMGISSDWESSKFLQNLEWGTPLRLQNLELANTRGVSDGFLQAIAERLPNIRKLDFTNCDSLSDDGLKAMIASCGGGLKKLVVTRCPQISDDSVRALAGVARNLSDISLARTKVSDDGLKALLDSEAVVSKLRYVSVASCQSVTDAGLQHFVSKQKQLVSFKILDVQSCLGVSVFGLQGLRDSMTERPWKIVSEKRNVTISF